MAKTILRAHDQKREYLDEKLRYIYHNPVKHQYTDTQDRLEYTSFRSKA